MFIVIATAVSSYRIHFFYFAMLTFSSVLRFIIPIMLKNNFLSIRIELKYDKNDINICKPSFILYLELFHLYLNRIMLI